MQETLEATYSREGNALVGHQPASAHLKTYVFTGPDGSFRVEKLAPGYYRPMAQFERKNFMYAPPHLNGLTSGSREQSMIRIEGKETVRGARLDEVKFERAPSNFPLPAMRPVAPR